MVFSGATNVGEFSQGAVIRTLEEMLRQHAADGFSERKIAMIKGGFCYAISLAWLGLAARNAAMEPPGMDMIHHGKNLIDSKDFDAYTYFSQIANDFIMYRESFLTRARAAHPEQFLTAEQSFENKSEIDMFFLPMASNGAIQPNGGADKTDGATAAAILGNPALSYIFFGFDALREDGKRRGGHRVAFCRRPSGALYFFDPNYGVHTVADEAALLANIQSVYKAASFCVTYA